MNFTRQVRLFNPAENELKLRVFGLGSVGSWFVLHAAKTGFKDIEAWDYDVVNEVNIPAQMFGYQHIDMLKTEAVAQTVKQFTQEDVLMHNEKVVEDTEILPEDNAVYISAVDSMAARKLIFSKIKKYPCFFVDFRIGLFSMKYYIVDTQNAKLVEEYEKSLDGPVGDLICGEKCLDPVNNNIVSEVIAQLIRISQGLTYNQVFMRDLMDYTFITRPTK